MSSINKMILLFAIVQVAIVLAKPQDRVWDDGLFHSDENMEDLIHKRATDCGGGCEPEGCYSRRCRSNCRSGEYHVSMFDNRCSGQKCCMCHVRWDCTYDG